MPNLDPYHKLLNILRRQAERLILEDYAGYEEYEQERVLALQNLPKTHSKESLVLLQELEALTRANTSSLEKARDTTAVELVRLGSSRKISEAYMGPSGGSGPGQWA